MSQSSPQSTPPPGALNLRASDLLLLLIFVLGLSRLLTGVADDITSPFAPTGEDQDHGGMGLAFVLLILQFLIVLGGCYLIVLRPYGLSLGDLGLGRFQARHLRLGVVSGIFALPLVTFVNYLLQSVQEQPFDNPQIDLLTAGGLSPAALFGFLFLGGIAAPFAEEVAFRGIFFGWLRGRMGGIPAVVLCGFCFALLHGIPQLIPALTAIGMLLAYLRLVSDSLWPPIIAHAVFNIASMLLVYAAMAQHIATGTGS